MTEKLVYETLLAKKLADETVDLDEDATLKKH